MRIRVSLFVCLLFVFLSVPLVQASEWTQDAGNAARTGYTAEDPLTPWTFAWSWNGPDSSGGASQHFYQQPKAYQPWEARTVTGGCCVFAPGSTQGLFAIRKSDGTQVWSYKGAAFHVAPAYDAASGSLFAAGDDGILYKFAGSTGTLLGQYATGSRIHKAVLLTSTTAYVLTVDGKLHAVRTDTMSARWVYTSGSLPQTLAAYSARRDVVIFATADLFVHAVRGSDGGQVWRKKPSVLSPGPHREFEGGWPVIAEDRGVVFVRMMIGSIEDVIFSGGMDKGLWPTTLTGIRSRLVNVPETQNLFALDLVTGEKAFIPAVGPGGVEDNGAAPYLRIHNFPVIRPLTDGSEVAYLQWQNGQVKESGYDGRWGSHAGEMLLNNTTIPGYQAGDVRFVQFEQHGSMIRITDEHGPMTMAGNVLFHAHWAASEQARITDRSNAVGASRDNPIKTTWLPPVLRAQTCPCPGGFSKTHFSSSCALQYDHGGSTCNGRYYGSPGFYSYYGILDPPTPKRDAYSEGILPRYTYVSDGLVIVEGNSGDLLALRHSGQSIASQSTPTPTPFPTTSPTQKPSPTAVPTPTSTPLPGTPTPACRADISRDGVVDITDYSRIVAAFFQTGPQSADITGDNIVDLSDYTSLVRVFFQRCLP